MTPREVEADIQEAFRSKPSPKAGDWEAWANRSADWQAAWAGCYARAAQLESERDAARDALKAAIPLLVRLGDFIGNQENRCEVISKAKDALNV